MFVRMALTVCLLVALPAADALASGGGFSLGLRGGRRAARRANVVVVQPAYVQQAVVVQKVRQQRVKVVQQPVYGSYSSFQSVYAAPVYAQQVYAAPVYAQPVQYAAPVQHVQQQQYASQSGSLDLQLGDLTRLLQKLSCVAECFATP